MAFVDMKPEVKNKVPKKVLLVERYQHAKNFIGGGVERLIWTDDELLNRPSITLKKFSSTAIRPVIKFLLNALAGGVSERAIGSILLISWNMINVDGDGVFPVDPEGGSPEDVDLKDLNTHVSYPVVSQGMDFSKVDDTTFHQAGSYLAASLLKLFTKEPRSWTKAYDHIKNSYQKFYDIEFPLGDLIVPDSVIDHIHSHFATKDVYRNTLGYLLYHMSGVSSCQGMIRMLFGQHLANTGMHSISLFLAAAHAGKFESYVLMSALHSRLTVKALETIMYIGAHYLSDPPPEAEKGTWRYSRLYDEKMFLSLQTKNCRELTCILAHLCEHFGVQGAGNILDIAVLRPLSKETQTLLARVAWNIYQTTLMEDTDNPMYKEL
ncbi:N putative capsid protein [Monoclea gottschei varicosa-like virus]|uniref:Nucleoprotein n=1 Tax=Monoclea gottschei varicosa-like virus TaxID=2933180 RepID=A0A9C7GWG2_9RHAB|nr:N putative capsid protein [Monoclea gottschei varicosa-like virus]CAI5383840.1 N putative capsid protein [Monoclea gottschei varicosa-like virus]